GSRRWWKRRSCRSASASATSTSAPTARWPASASTTCTRKTAWRRTVASKAGSWSRPTMAGRSCRCCTPCTGPDPSMTQAPSQAAAQPPFWLALLAGLPAIASLALMVIPDLGHGHAAVFKGVYLGLCLLWSVPLAALQRALWRRGTALWWLLGIVFATTYAMAVGNNLAGQLLAIAMGRKPDPVVQWRSEARRGGR